jgi:hypothetical protein
MFAFIFFVSIHLEISAMLFIAKRERSCRRELTHLVLSQ